MSRKRDNGGRAAEDEDACGTPTLEIVSGTTPDWQGKEGQESSGVDSVVNEESSSSCNKQETSNIILR